MVPGIHRTADAPLRWNHSTNEEENLAAGLACEDCGVLGEWTFLEKEVIYPAPDTVPHSLTVKLNHERELVLLVAHCDACGIEEEFWGELPRIEKYGARPGDSRLYARVERMATQHERARHGAAPRQVEGACGVMGHILHRGI
jgi:hypothetical protein